MWMRDARHSSTGLRATITWAMDLKFRMSGSMDSKRVVRGLFQSSTPMERSWESGRHVVSFRAAGWARFIPAAFLAFWLCGWAVGEVFAGGTLVLALLHVFSPATPMPFGIAA